MHARVMDWRDRRRELVLVAVAIILLARAIDSPAAWLVIALAVPAVALAAIGVLGGDEPTGVPVESLIVPSVLVGGGAAAIRLVELGLGVILAVALLGVLLERALWLEGRLVSQPTGPTDSDRSRVMLVVVIAAFVAFTGIGALVPGGLAQPGTTSPGVPGSGGLSEEAIVALAMGSTIVSVLLGYRSAAFRYGSVRDAAWSAATYGIVIAVAAGAVRAIDLPRLAGPALLTLVFYLWDAVHGTAPARRREPRFLWETILLVMLGVVVIAWNLRLRP